ncbi:actin-related protein 2/3 complex subunit 1A [Sigmodon hispidus]
MPKAHELKEHNRCITGIDWAPKSDCIITCGADQSSYVWNQKDEVDKKAANMPWGSKMPFGQRMSKFSGSGTGSWVNGMQASLPVGVAWTENNVVTSGHHCCLMLFNYDHPGCLTFVSKTDVPKQSIQRNMSSMKYFCNMDKRTMTEDRNIALETLHQNSITPMSIYEVDNQDRPLAVTENFAFLASMKS